MPTWIRCQAVAAAASLAVALVLHAIDCSLGTHEACLISRGLLSVYWFGVYALAGAPIALAVTRTKRSDERADSGS